MKVLLTGATGAIGTLLCERLREVGDDITTIGRRGVIRWDLNDPLPVEVRRALPEVDVLVHAGADIRLGAGWDELQPANVEATAALGAAVASAPRPPRLIYVSSAFAPPRAGAHNNAYERSKWAAEEALGASGAVHTVVRPSLVIGSTGTGRILRFSGIYQFLRMLAHGLVPAVPGLGEVRLDVIPVDVVAGLIADEIADPSGQAVVPASSGAAAPTLRQLVDILFEVLPSDRVKPKFVSQEVYHRLFRPLIEPELSGAQLALLEMIEIFLPYFDRDHSFTGVPGLEPEAILSTWKASIEYWLVTEGITTDRGLRIWAKR